MINEIKPFDNNDLPIQIIQRIRTVDYLITRIKSGKLVLNNGLQSQPKFWTLKTKSRFIESLIVNIPTPAFYFDGNDDDKWLVIDGLQRLNAIIEYINGDFQLTGLDFLSNLEGRKFGDLERAYQRSLEEYNVSVCLFPRGTRQIVKYKIYQNINSSRLTQSF